ncbi:MAG: flagellar export chaperone FliS [Rhodoferax sp.]|nr:flagellar export chaperone FliS [Rhodoferax sp.]MBP9147924.1 flagellar export chaperone FliS [Rhodoferax sp.]MBP9735015.1 flagellar export chaperone FliS [Rhodoferax sp.]
MYLPIHSRAASSYSRVGVETSVLSASPHELISLLFNGVFETLSLAQCAIEQKDIATKGKAISKATRLISEGLKGGLSPDGGELTVQLTSLYDYCVGRLMHANLKNDTAAIEEVVKLIQPIASSWQAIRSDVTGGV